MKNIAFFCKTYINDIDSIDRLVSSFNAFNADNIDLYLSVPESDFDLFKQFEKFPNIKVITDESYAKNYFVNSPIWNLKSGYINQEICKLAFAETQLCENYLCLDSDVQFIRNFYISDFMYNENTPYTVLVMDKELSSESYYKNFWKFRSENIKKIYDFVGLDDRRYRSSHGMVIINSKVMKSFREDFMQPQDLTYKNLMEISPLEFTWYNVWFQKCKLVDEVTVEPFFKTFHSRIEYLISRFKNNRLENYAKSYVGIVLNGNWKRKELKYKNPDLSNKFVYFLLRNVF